MSDNTTVLTTISAETPTEGGNPDGEMASDVIEGAPQEGADPAVEAAAPTDPKLEMARKFDAIARREARGRRFAEEVDRGRAAMAKEQAAFNAEREAFRAEQATLRSELEAFRADPVGYELKSGRDPVEAVRRFAQPETETEKELRALKERMEARDKRDEERELAQRRVEEAKSRTTMLQGFVGSITSDECPNLVSMYPDANAIPGLVQELLNEEGEDGATLLDAFKAEHRRNPTDKEIRQALEHRASLRARHLFDGLKRIYEPSSQSASAAPSSTGGPSLSNQHAGKLVTGNGARKLSLEERRAQGLAAIRNQLEAETE